ncbi:YigZ family protein [Marinobacter sp.]|uniref:IMPACT family protein n=1 Tax=Marinobacter sp. TaxID=50741 RepID=UPI002B46225F|nr:YigZ family protein [Marinobacter sp.]HKK56046.1 YigZ family protein [Marinobacter sp.]
MMKDYPVPAGYLERETEVKKSRFIASVAPVGSRNQVKEWLERAHHDHPDARHICWAYQLGRPGAAAEAAMNDDGEPSGTAGRPILGVIQHKDMGDVLVMVVRYFGGVKLGAGGLVRAYAGAAESVLADVERVIRKPLEIVYVIMGFADEQPLRHWCESHDGAILDIEYGIAVTATVELTVEDCDELTAFCNSRGLEVLTKPQRGEVEQ